MKYFLIAILMWSSFHIVFAQKKNKNVMYTMTLKTYPKTMIEPDIDTLFFIRLANRKGLNVMSKEKLVLSISENGSVAYCDSVGIKDTNMMAYSFLYRRLVYSHPDSTVHVGKGYKSTGPIRLKRKSTNYAGEYTLLGEKYFFSISGVR